MFRSSTRDTPVIAPSFLEAASTVRAKSNADWHNDELPVPTMALGRLHTKAAVIDDSIVYIGSVNLDPRSDSTNTELGMLALPGAGTASHRVIATTQRGALSAAVRERRRYAEWLTNTDAGELVLRQEPEATPLMRLKTCCLDRSCLSSSMRPNPNVVASPGPLPPVLCMPLVAILPKLAGDELSCIEMIWSSRANQIMNAARNTFAFKAEERLHTESSRASS